MSLQPDFSLVIQIVSFFILWLGMKRLLFDPVLDVLKQREARTVGVRHEVATMQTATDAAAAEYERRMQEIRHTLAAEAEANRAATQAEERRALTAAREQASARLTRLREDLGRQAEAARPALAAEARQLANGMFERVVGRRPA